VVGGSPAGRPDDAFTIVDSPEFATLLSDGLVVPPAEPKATSRKFIELRRRLEDTTACIVFHNDVTAETTSVAPDTTAGSGKRGRSRNR
jgi:hypothetical protein